MTKSMTKINRRTLTCHINNANLILLVVINFVVCREVTHGRTVGITRCVPRSILKVARRQFYELLLCNYTLGQLVRLRAAIKWYDKR